MSKKRIKTTDVQDVRVGDIAHMEHEGHAWQGPVWKGFTGGLLVGSSDYVRYSDGERGVHFLYATREVPKRVLPSGPGSVIVDATIRGEKGHTAMLDEAGFWMSPIRAGGHFGHEPRYITKWTTARIVAAEEA